MNFLIMNKIIDKIRKIPLPVLCYIVFIAIFIIYSLFCFISDSVLRANGKIEEQQLKVIDFLLRDAHITSEGSGIVCETDDPQMILELQDEKIRTLRFKANYSSYPYEINLYYINKNGEPYSQNKRVWPDAQKDGSYEFTLPRKEIVAIRLDAASATVVIDFEEIVINEKKPFYEYINPGWKGLFSLIVWPLMAAAILRWMRDVFVHYYKKHKRKV